MSGVMSEAELEAAITRVLALPDGLAVGDLFVFVGECRPAFAKSGVLPLAEGADFEILVAQTMIDLDLSDDGPPELDLARLAGLRPAGVLCEVVKPDGTMARVPDLIDFCAEHGLLLISIDDIVRYRHRTERLDDLADFIRRLVQRLAVFARLEIGCEGLAAALHRLRKIECESFGIEFFCRCGFGGDDVVHAGTLQVRSGFVTAGIAMTRSD